jgi:hypothetical protein
MTAAGKITAGRKTGRDRGYVAWAPQKKTMAILEQVQSILTEYRAHWPVTGRQILYRMIGRFDFPKENEDQLYYLLGRARRARLIPFEAIRDDGVVTYSPEWYDSPDDFWDGVDGQIREYRRDRQAGQPHRIELWCEAEGMAPQLAQVANDYSVKVFTCGGANSITAIRQIVDRARLRDGATVLLHIGDFDPYGENIFNALVEDAQAFLEEDRIIGTQRIEPIRVALTVDQVEEFDLPTQKTKASKNGSKAHETIRQRWIEQYGDRTCQVEALAPDQLAEVVDNAIREQIVYIDSYHRQVDEEAVDRDAMLRALPAGSGE